MAIPSSAAVGTPASTLRGCVLEDEPGGRPLPQVEIQLPGIPRVATDAEGRFTISLLHAGPEIPLRLEVFLPGHAPICPSQLDVNLRHHDASQELTILLSAEAVREKMALRQYRLAWGRAVQAAPLPMADQKAPLPEPSPELLRRHRRDRDLALRARDLFASLLAGLQVEAMSAQSREALNHFLQGRMPGALSGLEAAWTPGGNGQPPPPASSLPLEDHLLLACLMFTQLRFRQARSVLERAAAAFPVSHAGWHSLALLEQALQRHPEARTAFTRALERARSGEQPEAVADILVGLGHLAREEQRFEEARRAWREALEDRRRLADASPDRPFLRAGVAAILNDMGNLHLDLRHTIPARSTYTEALGLYRELAKDNPAAFAPLAAVTWSNLGVLAATEGKREEARHAFCEAIQGLREIAVSHPSLYAIHLARSLFNLGLLEQQQNRLPSAEEAYTDCLARLRSLADEQPVTFTADTLTNLGALYRQTGRAAEAIASWEAALAGYREAAEEKPERFRPSVERLQTLIRELKSTAQPARP